MRLISHNRCPIGMALLLALSTLLVGNHNAEAARHKTKTKAKLNPPQELVTEAPAWWNNMTASAQDGSLRPALESWLRKELTPPVRKTLYDAMERTIVTAPPETRSNLVSIIAPLYMKTLLERCDTQQATHFLKSQDAILTASLPFQTAMWRLQLAIMTGNSEQAGQSLAKAILANPAYTNSTEYLKSKETIFKLNANTALPLTMDLTPQSVPDALDAFARSGDTNRLCTYLKEVLRTRNENALSMEGDASLFIGSKPYYRQVLAKYAPLYDTWLNQEILNLSKQPSRQADAARLSRIARLTPAGDTTGPDSVGPSAAAPLQSSGFIPLVDMTPGTVEVSENHLRFMTQGDSTPIPVASLSIRGGQTWLSNSRMLTRLQSGRVLWSWAAPLQRITESDSTEAAPFHLLGKTQPAVAGSVVAISALIQNAALWVVGLDRETGAYRWGWHSDSATVASDPASWGTNRLVVMQLSGQPARAELVTLDAATGKSLLTLPVSSSQTPGSKTSAGALVCNQDSSWKLPAPTIVGDRAYVSSSMGLIGAINLTDESLLWLRNYTRFEDPALMGLRHPASPVVGRTAVLFAPWDSNSLLLTDKTSGKLLALRTDLPWCEVAPCGPDHALITTPTTTHLVSLTDLKDVKMLTGRNSRLLQAVREGCLILAPDATTSLIQPNGYTSILSPESDEEQILGCDPEGNWYAAGGPGLQWCGVKMGATGTLPALRHPQLNLPSTCTLTDGLLLSTNGATPLALAGQILTPATTALSPRWELPTPGNPHGVLALKDRVIMAHSGRLWIYDAQSGDLTHTLPEGTATTPKLSDLFPGPGSPGFALGQDEAPELALWELDANGHFTGPPVARMDKEFSYRQFERFAILSSPSHISAIVTEAYWGQPSSIWTAPRKPEPAILTATKAPPCNYIWVSSDGSQGAAVMPTGWFYTIDASGFHDGRTEFLLSQDTWQSKGTWSSGNLIESRRDADWTEYLNPMTGTIFNPKKQNVRPSAVIGTQVYGIKIDGFNIHPFTYNVQGDKAAIQGKPLPPWAATLPLSGQWQARATLNGGTPMLLLMPPPLDANSDNMHRMRKQTLINLQPPPRNDGVAIVWANAATQTAYRVPNIPREARIWSTPQGLVNIAGTWMSATQWETALHLRDSVRTCSATSGAVTVDGFLSEWSTNEFFSIPNGTMAVRMSAENELAIAVKITNPRLAEQLGIKGLNGQLELSALPDNEIFFGEPPSLSPQAPLTQGTVTEFYLSSRYLKNTKTATFAWTVHPDGKTCQIEAIVKDIPVERESRTAQPVGVRMLWYSNPLELPVNLVSETPFGPLSYVTVKF
ncbi:MAG: PQQ-binding-like beta-propeller repeat protein [bacterium]